MFYDNILKLYRNKLSIKKIIANNIFIIKSLIQVDAKFSIFLVLKTLFYSFNAIIYSYMLKNIVQVIEQKQAYKRLVLWVFMIALLFAFERLIAYISTRYKDIVSVKYTMHMNQVIYNKIAVCELENHENPEWNNRLNNALSVNRDAFSIISVFAEFISSIISLITVSAVLFVYKWYLCILVMLISIIVALISSKNKRLQYNYQMDTANERRRVSYYPSVLFNGDFAKERKLFGYSEWLIKRYEDDNIEIINKLKELCKKIGRNLLMTGILSNILSILILLLVGQDALSGRISIATYSLYISLFSSFTTGVNSLLNSCVLMQEKSLYLDYLLDFTYEIANKVVFNGKEKVIRQDEDIIEFEHVYYKYPSECDYTIKDMNFTFRSNEKICLVGVNGAGKTTTIKLLLGLYAPTKGRILFNGVDLQRLDIEDYRKMFSCCFQDFCKYSFTVAENLLFHDIEPHMASRIKKALNEVGLLDKINQFDQGIDTPLTRYYAENGRELSGGEWQKLVLARILLTDNNFLVLDEPSSNLDSIAENNIFNIVEKSKNNGVLFISHRLSAARISDKIIVIAGGEIKEMGNHEELIRVNGEYSRLFKLQAERY